DEQHRFGVLQRAALQRRSAESVDVLVMSATPIPRTLALTLYGDLAVSTLDELPPGRTPITTELCRESRREGVYGRIRGEIAAGHQAYIVYPLVEESEKSALRAASTMVHELAAGPLAGLRLALVHGRMKAEEKDAVMRRFKAGEHDVLVSTTVIEVGIDVPNATAIVIEHAERFGLAQLHQLRGRVGRGRARGHCFLVVPDWTGEEAYQRLRTLEQSTDGFHIAEADLALRGPGPGRAGRGGGGPRPASVRRPRAGCPDRPPPAAPHRRCDGPPAPPRLPAALFGPACVPHVCRRHAESKQAMGFRRVMFRGVTKARDGMGPRLRRLRALGRAAA